MFDKIKKLFKHRNVILAENVEKMKKHYVVIKSVYYEDNLMDSVIVSKSFNTLNDATDVLYDEIDAIDEDIVHFSQDDQFNTPYSAVACTIFNGDKELLYFNNFIVVTENLHKYKTTYIFKIHEIQV